MCTETRVQDEIQSRYCNDVFLLKYIQRYFIFPPSLPPGSRLPPPPPPPPLLLHHPRPLSLAALPHVDRTPQRRLVLPAVDAVHLHGDAPRPGRRAPRPVGVSVRKHGPPPLLAVRQHHGNAAPLVFCAHVPNRDQGRDLHQTRGGHRCVDVLPDWLVIWWGYKMLSETTFRNFKLLEKTFEG